MKRLIDLSNDEARVFFLRGSSYFNGDFPEYINFEPLLQSVSGVLNDGFYADYKKHDPGRQYGVNYSFVTNKDGRFAWRPFELMNPAIYVSLVNLICKSENWKHIQGSFEDYETGTVECSSAPMVSDNAETDKAVQVQSWWQRLEQRSLLSSLEFSHVLHTDVSDCYGSLYTHSISWALHGLEVAKQKDNASKLGNDIDRHIQSSRFGQTNGISQGSVLMDFVAEMVLGYVDKLVSGDLPTSTDYRILRYRDDYRIFTNSDERAESILKLISEKLRSVGMKLNTSKTSLTTNAVSGSVKEDKLAGIELQDLGDANAKTVQKQLLRLHAFGRRFPNSGALRRLVGEFHSKITKQKIPPDDLEVQIAIATDIAFVSPLTFPAVAGILSHLISLASSQEDKSRLWALVQKKMARVPHNGYLEIWLQRVTKPKAVGIEFISGEPICKIVNGDLAALWNNDWVSSKKLVAAMDVSQILIKQPEEAPEVMPPEEIELFNKNAIMY
ncbi:RNA-directed DNA polymerase [Rhizobium ruizarguesonis]|nr:RNA-directed DNA polymerase [Rhizobium ruizarguesonis]QIJ43056.1 RNA-directed DNA polymerase [Rhizobium leguminosarum]NEH29210.1 hypothetical protein [Rhizobium ruizarguesonis]NEJ09040.1 hypothetical protein [Rhizobium ruizarguesonis]NEK07159.1 hypothetical protein [Rhizobium ruizarguesonis]TAW80160.1 RNA-directed DNA polymerase [Rhizobium ruizarguesonis]